MAVAHIRRPADFTLPADPDHLFAALREMSAESLEEFAREVLDSLGAVKPEDDFRPILVVLERWYRAALLQQHPGWEHAVDQARTLASGERPADIHELDDDQLRREVTRRRRSA